MKNKADENKEIYERLAKLEENRIDKAEITERFATMEVNQKVTYDTVKKIRDNDLVHLDQKIDNVRTVLEQGLRALDERFDGIVNTQSTDGVVIKVFYRILDAIPLAIAFAVLSLLFKNI